VLIIDDGLIGVDGDSVQQFRNVAGPLLVQGS
jgi:hypothetical protein